VQIDTIVKANCSTRVIPPAQTVAEKVIRQQVQKDLDEKGASVSRERWHEHRNVPDMVRDYGLAYRDTDNNDREVYFPVCLNCRRVESHEVIKVYANMCSSRKAIGGHVVSQRHKHALDEEQRESKREVRRRRIGLNIARTALQTLREGASYVQFEHKLQSLHLAGVDIDSISHSREFIRGFVESMTDDVMDKRVSENIRAIDPITGRKRVFAFMADKVTELHRTRDAVVLMIMSEKGELQVVFADYLFVTGHTREALMGQIYDETFIKKLGLTPTEITVLCTGAAFDGAYFHMNSPDQLAKRIVEQAKGCPTTRSEIRNLVGWLLCTWDPAHRLELVVNDIRNDKLGVDDELMSAPWYAEIPKDNASMYSCYSYGK
jgi:hypothetical protein